MQVDLVNRTVAIDLAIMFVVSVSIDLVWLPKNVLLMLYLTILGKSSEKALT
jgi:hypothetical protein